MGFSLPSSSFTQVLIGVEGRVNGFVKGVVQYGSVLLLFLALAVIVGAAIGYPVMWLWNELMPELFGLGRITFWQAVGLYLLAQALFGTIGSKKKKDN